MEPICIEKSQARQRLDQFLASCVVDVSRSRLQKWIKNGLVLVNGAPAKAGYMLREGDVLTVTRMEPDEPSRLVAEEIPLNIIFEDSELIVINKPAGMVVHPGAGNWTGTVANALAYHLGHRDGGDAAGGVRPGIVHRLDKDTSGLMVLARNESSQWKLARAFALRNVEKSYLALVEGTPVPTRGNIHLPVRRHPVHRKKMLAQEGERGRDAHTGYQVLASDHGISLVECTLHTGRTHQIRVHMKAINHPLLGDSLYNAGNAGKFPRQMLHAWRLSIPHPVTGEKLDFCVAPPQDFLDIMDPGWMNHLE